MKSVFSLDSSHTLNNKSNDALGAIRPFALVETGLQAYTIGQKHIDKKFFGFLQCIANLVFFLNSTTVAVIMVLQSQEGGESYGAFDYG